MSALKLDSAEADALRAEVSAIEARALQVAVDSSDGSDAMEVAGLVAGLATILSRVLGGDPYPDASLPEPWCDPKCARQTARSSVSCGCGGVSREIAHLRIERARLEADE